MELNEGGNKKPRTALIINRLVFAHEHYGNPFCQLAEDAV
jgi:hypothetical protein